MQISQENFVMNNFIFPLIEQIISIMNQGNNRSKQFARTTRTQSKSRQGAKTITKQTKKQEQPPRPSLKILRNLDHKFKSMLLLKGFFRISLNKNKEKARQITFRYLSALVKQKIKFNLQRGLGKIGQASIRRRSVIHFSKMLVYLQKSKIIQYSERFFKKLQLLCVKKKLNQSQEQAIQKIKNTSEEKGRNLQRKPPLNSSSSSLRKRIDSLPSKVNQSDEKDKEQQQKKMMELSEEVKSVLLKIQRFDRFIYAKQAEKISKQALYNEMKRLEKIKNSSKSMRGKNFDSQLTITALYNHVKLISQMSSDIETLKSNNPKLTREKNQNKTLSEEQILEMKQKIKKYQYYQKKVLTISSKIQNGQIWNREFDLLKRDEKLSGLKALDLLVSVKEQSQKKQVENIQKISEKIALIFENAQQIKIKKGSIEKKILELNRLFELNNKKNPHIFPIFEVIHKKYKNQFQSEESFPKSDQQTQKNIKQNKMLKQSVKSSEEKIKQITLILKEKDKQLQQLQNQKLVLQKKSDALQKQSSKSILLMKEYAEQKKIDHFRREIKNLIKIYQKYSLHMSVVSFLSIFEDLSFYQDKPPEQKSGEKKFSRTPEKKNSDTSLMRFMKRCEVQIKRNKYKGDDNFWNTLLPETSEQQIIYLTKIMKLWTEREQQNEKVIQLLKQQNNQFKSRNLSQIAQLKHLKKIISKQNILNDEYWEKITENNDDPFLEELKYILSRFSKISKQKLFEQRKDYQQTIKGYEQSIIELNNIIQKLDNKIVEKQKEQETPQVKKADERRSASLSRSRKSIRSNTSEKDNEIKNLRTSMQAYALEEKNMLEKIAFLEDQKNSLQKKLLSIEAEYLRQRNLWGNQQQAHQEEIEEVKSFLQSSHKSNVNELLGEINAISEQKDLQLRQLHFQLEKNKVEFQRELQLLQNTLAHRQDYEQLKFALTVMQKENQQLKNRTVQGGEDHTNIQLSRKVIQLETMFNNVREEQNKIIQSEVMSALKNQEEDFNRFLEQHNLEREQYYENVVIPQRIHENSVQQKLEGSAQHTNWEYLYHELKLESERDKRELQLAFQSNQDKQKIIREFKSHSSEIDKELERRMKQEIQDLKNKLQIITKSEESQIKSLKEVIHNQKIQLNQLQLIIRSLKDAKEQLIRQKQDYYKEIQNTLFEKSKQIQKLRSQYELKIVELIDEKYSLEQKVLEGERVSKNSQSLRILEVQTKVNSKILEISQLQEFLTKKNVEIEDYKRKNEYLQRQVENLKVSKGNFQSYILKLESDISALSQENKKYQRIVSEVEGRQMHLRNEMIRIKTESSLDNAEYMKQQIRDLKKQILLMNKRQTPKRDQENKKIRGLLKDMQVQRGIDRDYDEAEIEILQKIDEEVSELVETNRQLETKLIILEGYMDSNDSIIDVVNFFLIFQNQMEQIVNFLFERGLISNGDLYNQFLQESRNYLSECDYDEYFTEWGNMMKLLLGSLNEQKNQELKQKAEEMIELKEQMSEILDKQIEYSEDQNFETLEKYKMIFTDIKFLLKEYIKGEDPEYLNMICRSLGFEAAQF